MEININDYEKVVKQLRERKRTRKTRRTANSGKNQICLQTESHKNLRMIIRGQHSLLLGYMTARPQTPTTN